MFWFLSDKINNALKSIDVDSLFEIRIRNGLPIKVLVKNKWGYLSASGFSICTSKAIIADDNEAQLVAVRASENSLYSVFDNVAKGFLTLKDGTRIGLCGECVRMDGKIKTFKNFSSVTVRIPHEITNASNNFFNYIIQSENVKNTLIVSPPGGGKTTVLRDIGRKLSFSHNVLIVDERYELAGICNGKPFFNVGECDVISGCNKSVALENALRSCAPDVIITDEICEDDYFSIRQAISGGVKIITSIHSDSVENLFKKPNFEKFLSNKIFDLFIVLQGRNNPGKCVSAYNENITRIY